jgi:CBS domain-containing protein
MRVSEIMMRTPACCTLETNLGAAVEILWNRNCGILPVVDVNNKVTAVITDRDICIALGTRDRRAGEITVAEVASTPAYCCQPTDEVHDALGKMARAKVRRLPVVNREGRAVGILSMDDIVLHVRAERQDQNKKNSSDLSTDEVVRTLEAIYGGNLPTLLETKIGCN